MKTRLLFTLALLACSCSPLTSNELWQYDVTGPVKEITLHSDTLALPWTASFDRSGHLTKMTIFNFDGSEQSVRSYTYNLRKQVTKASGLFAPGEPETYHIYKYDGAFVKECTAYDMDDKEVYRWVSENDGKHIVRTEYYYKGELQYTADKVFTDSSYRAESHTPDGVLNGFADVEFYKVEEKPTHIISNDGEITIKYDENGLPVMSQGAVVNSVGTLQWPEDLAIYPCRYYSYEFDERCNWITRYERKEPDSPEAIVLKRTIIYY